MAGAVISRVEATEILDSRGLPTVQAKLWTQAGMFRAKVPSGKSTGSREAHELRDKDTRFGGKGVLKAVANINGPIAKAVVGRDPTQQEEIDRVMRDLDGTPNLKNLGANAVLAVSLAVSRAGACAKQMPLYRHFADLKRADGKISLPVPSFNVLNGGAHAGNLLGPQEFMFMPIGAKTFREAVEMGAECYHALGAQLLARYGRGAVNVGDEGGFAPPISTATEALDRLTAVIEQKGFTKEVVIALDVAASELYDKDTQTYDLAKKDPERKGKDVKTSEEMDDFYQILLDNYPIASIEDPYHESDWAGFARLTRKRGNRTQIVGDDLLVTNPTEIARAIREDAVTAALIKPNQNGTMTGTLEAIAMAHKAGKKTMVSHRSGETTDTGIMDLAVGTNALQIKAGAPNRGERTCKYDRGNEISHDLVRKLLEGTTDTSPGELEALLYAGPELMSSLLVEAVRA